MIRRLLVPVALVGTLAACGGSSDDAPSAATGAPETTSAPDSTPPTEAAETGGSAVIGAPAALQFTAPLVGGGDIEMATLAGRPVLLWFWAPW